MDAPLLAMLKRQVATKNKGEVASVAALPSTGNKLGDLYKVTSNGALYIWGYNASGDKAWVQMGAGSDALAQYVQDAQNAASAAESSAEDAAASAAAARSVVAGNTFTLVDEDDSDKVYSIELRKKDNHLSAKFTEMTE